MRDDDSPLNSDGGGGNYGGMEPRVAALEADMKEIKSDLKKVLVDLSYLRGKVDAMPTTLQPLVLLSLSLSRRAFPDLSGIDEGSLNRLPHPHNHQRSPALP